MKAKKVLGFVLAGTMIAALAGCGQYRRHCERKDRYRQEREQQGIRGRYQPHILAYLAGR